VSARASALCLIISWQLPQRSAKLHNERPHQFLIAQLRARASLQNGKIPMTERPELVIINSCTSAEKGA
jgi:hypothetical protein